MRCATKEGKNSKMIGINHPGRRPFSAEIEQQLRSVKSRIDQPQDYLTTLKDVLRRRAQYLALERTTMTLDFMRMKVKGDSAKSGNQITLTELVSGNDLRRVAVVVRVLQHELPA